MPNVTSANTPGKKTDAGPEIVKSPESTQTAGKSSVGAAKQPLKDAASDAVEGAKGMASDLAQTAKEGASTAWDSLQGAVDGQKKAGADRVAGIAAAMREAADAFDKDVPPVARYVRDAARELGNASDALREKSVGDLVGTVQDFARRKSGLFLGLSAIGGFALVRFLNSSKRTDGGASQPGPKYLVPAKITDAEGDARPYGSTAR